MEIKVSESESIQDAIERQEKAMDSIDKFWNNAEHVINRLEYEFRGGILWVLDNKGYPCTKKEILNSLNSSYTKDQITMHTLEGRLESLEKLRAIMKISTDFKGEAYVKSTILKI